MTPFQEYITNHPDAHKRVINDAKIKESNLYVHLKFVYMVACSDWMSATRAEETDRAAILFALLDKIKEAYPDHVRLIESDLTGRTG